MQKLKIGVVEDEVIIADNIVGLLNDLNYNVCEPCSNYDEAIAMLETDTPDFLLLDINLTRSRDGIEVAKYIRENFNIPFIFLTANSDSATLDRAKYVTPNGYLVKPFQKASLYTTIEIALFNFQNKSSDLILNNNSNASNSNKLFIKEGQFHHKINFDDVLYLSSDHVYVTVHTAHKKFLVRSSLQEYAEQFDPRQFVRVHRGFVVNMNKIEKINSSHLIIRGEQIPISRNHREMVMGALTVC